MKRIPLIKPYMTDEIKDRVNQVLDSGYMTEGPVTQAFEAACRDYIGCDYALAVCNCTVGLEMALRAYNIGPGDEVIVPGYTYPATACVAPMVGSTVVFVDVDPVSMLMDLDLFEKAITPKTKAVIPVSLFGNPMDYERLMAISRKHGLVVIEDAACSIGADWRDKKVGNWADVSVFSFHPRKFITTGEGGMVTTDDPRIAEWMDAYKHFGITGGTHRAGIVFGQIGTNFKMSDVVAAIGLVQMRHIDELLAKRRYLAKRYRDLMKDVPGVRWQKITEGGVSSYQSCCALVDHRDAILQPVRADGVEIQVGSYALHRHPAFQDLKHFRVEGALEGSEEACDHCMTFPMYHDLTDEDQDIVMDRVTREIRQTQVSEIAE